MTSLLKRKSISRPGGEGKRQIIIEAALKVMISEGLYRATTRKIAEAAGQNLATLHYHFNNKEEIFFLAMEHLFFGYRQVLASHFKEPQSLYDLIPVLVHFVWREIEKGPDEQLALQELTIYLLRHPEAAALAKEKDREVLALYVDTLKKASDAGERSEAEIVAIANLVYTGLIGIFNQWLATRDRALVLVTLDNLAKAAQDMVVRKA